MSLRIRYACPHCERRITHHPELAGQLVICSACKGEFYEPTDPLPGKPAEKALKPMKNEKRHLRVPVGMDQKHDLAVLSRTGSSDLRSIEELVEAVLIDGGDPSAPDPATLSDTISELDPIPFDDGPADNSPQRDSAEKSPSRQAPSLKDGATSQGAASQGGAPSLGRPGGKSPAPRAPKLSGPAVRPLMPPSLKPPTNPSSAAQPPNFTSPVPAFRPPQKTSDPPALPRSKALPKTPAVTNSLNGVSIDQMLEELRRRGLGVAMIACEMAPARNHKLHFSENMTRDDALALLHKYLDSLRTPPEKPSNRSGVLKRLWKSEEEGKPE